MRTSTITIAAVGLLASGSALAVEQWTGTGEAGFTTTGAQATSPLTREQFVAKWDDEKSAMAAKGYRWDQLYMTYRYVGAGAVPVAAAGPTRGEMMAREQAEKRDMAAKGYRWNQLFSTYQYVGTPR